MGFERALWVIWGVFEDADQTRQKEDSALFARFSRKSWNSLTVEKKRGCDANLALSLHIITA